MKKHFALNYLMSRMWAVDQSLLSIMGDIATRKFSADELSDVFELSQLENKVDALEGKSGSALTPSMELREGGVAVIHVNGVISRYSSLFQAICGGTSTQALAKDLTQAVNDPAIRSIVLNVDSPGGDANGIHEFAEMVYQARGQKPIKAYAGGDCASAAYWIATAADEVVIDATARLGSIGVVMTIQRAKDDEDVETLEIVSSQSPNKRLDPSSKEGKKAYQARLDELADIFVDRVARNMAVERETVLEEFGQGGILIGQSAVDKGMATKLGSLEGVVAELQNGKTSMKNNKKTNAGDGESTVFALPNAAELSAEDVISALTEHRPDVLEAISGPTPLSALSAAAEIAQSCAAAGIPALSANLLKEGVTKAQADAQIKAAISLKDTLSAAGLSDSFEALVANMDDPIKLVGQAIHETKAASDESGDGSRHVVDAGEKPVALSAKDIYAKRKSK